MLKWIWRHRCENPNFKALPSLPTKPISSSPHVRESGILGFGIRNTAHGVQKPTKSWNPESSTWNPESMAWNPESKTTLDYLACMGWSSLTMVPAVPRLAEVRWYQLIDIEFSAVQHLNVTTPTTTCSVRCKAHFPCHLSLFNCWMAAL